MNDPLGKPSFLSEEQWRVHLAWLKTKQERQEEPEKLEPYNFSGWDDQPVPPQEWTLQDKIPRRQTCLFSGEGAAGKSTIALHLCAAHVLGRDCLGSLAEQGPAFFIDAEDEIGVIHRRLAAITQHYDVKFSDLIAGGLHLFPLAGKDAVMAAPRKNVIFPTELYNQILGYASRLKPQCIVIASSANVYAGSEIDRPQVTQFIGLMTRLAIAANGAVVLVSHPSLTGIDSDSGISGSTQWHNATRARLVLKTIKQDKDAPAQDAGLRLLECKKNQYGPPSESLTLQWRNGMFLPQGGQADFERAAEETKARNQFEIGLKAFIEQGRNVSHKPKSNNYAPALLAKADGGLSRKAYEKAMEQLFNEGVIRVDAYDRFGHERLCFV